MDICRYRYVYICMYEFTYVYVCVCVWVCIQIGADVFIQVQAEKGNLHKGHDQGVFTAVYKEMGVKPLSGAATEGIGI